MRLVAAQAVANARAAIVTRQLPQGMCLNFVWRMYGSLNSTGYAQGTLASARTSWQGSQHHHGPEEPIPIGAPVYFGQSPTRTDKNNSAWDVTIHVGGGILACTDASGANTGFMTIAARARQTQRPYIGWTSDFGGREIDFGVTVIPAHDGKPAVIIPEPKEDEVYLLANADTHRWVVVTDGHAEDASVVGGGAFEAITGRPRVALPDAQFNAAIDYFLHLQETGLYALTDGDKKDRWFVMGPTCQFFVDGDDIPFWQGRLGSRRAVSTRDFNRIARQHNQEGV